MKSFKFQQFEINQSEKVFRVGTDGVLLGALCNVEKAVKILEVGTGTGLISLMLAQRKNAEILALDIDKNAAYLASENFKNSTFSNRLKAIQQDFKNFHSVEKFNLIVSNPPYFEENQSQKNVLARQTVALSFSDLIKNAKLNLSSEGIFSVIIPSYFCEEFIEICKSSNLYLIRKINIYGIENGLIKRNILEFSNSPKSLVEEDFIIEKSPRQYSEQYLEATKGYHVFKN